METNKTSFIVARQLNIFSPQGVLLVENLDLQLGRERVALVGESGSGKSLTARALMGLLAPSLTYQAEQLTIDNQNVLAWHPRQWDRLRGGRIAMVMQDPKYALNPSRTIGWQVEEPLKIHCSLSRSERREKVISMLAAVGLPQPQRLMKRYPHQLSGGMGQRVMLAIALVTDPDYLIADEPTSALDQMMRDQVLNLIRKLVEQRNMGLLLISHDLQQVAEHTQRVMVMYQGRLLDSLPAADLPNASHPYTRTLWACRPSLATKGKPLPTLDRQALEAMR